jgi:FtsZ-binding cell division protein ZapB
MDPAVQTALQELQAQVQQLQAENVSLKTGQQSLQQENEALRAQQTGVAEMAKSLGDLAKSLESKSERKDRRLLVDTKGLGKPETFNNDEQSFRRWARTVCNLTVGVFGKEFQDVLDY